MVLTIQYEYLAVRALLLGASEMGFPAAFLASFEVEVGQVEDRYPVRYVEQVFRQRWLSSLYFSS